MSRPTRRRMMARLAALLGAAAGIATRPSHGQPAATSGEVLRIALVPYLSARAMLTQFEPMRRHLERRLGRPVEMFTAASFRALAEGARAGDPPVTMMPMHLARIAVADWGQTLVVRSARESKVQLIAARKAALGSAQALRGKRVAAIDPLSVTSLMLERWLVAEKLDGAVEVLHLPSANAAVLALGRGDVAAMAVAQGQALDVPGLRADELEVVATLGSVLTPCFVAHPRLGAAAIAALRQALLDFEPASAGGGASSATFVEGQPRDLETYESYAVDARRLLGAR
jgi:phosphonate transport system substrate-binding protein